MDDVIDTLRVAAKVCLVAWIFSTMLGMGLQLKVREVLEPLRNAVLVTLAIIANYVLVPLLGYLILHFLPLSQGFRTGLVLAAVGAGAPFLPMLSEMSKGNRAWAAALMLLLTVATVVYMPLALPLLLTDVEVDPLAIARSLVLMLLPLVAGLFIRARNESLALHLTSLFGKTANITLIPTLALVVILGYPELLHAVGRFGILAAAILVLGGTAIGYVLGGPRRDMRVVLGFGTGSRNVAAALAVAAQNFGNDPDVTLMCILVTLAMVGLQAPLAKWLGRGACSAA